MTSKPKAQLHKVDKSQISTKKKGGNLVKNLVSKKKRRFKQDGYDLDLTYITKSIIAMGFPSSSMEAVYRNNIDDVIHFLESRHGSKYMVYNLCSEKSYDHSKFNNQVVRFPFDDHNCPKFDDLEPFCEALDEWLCADPENIAAIHCKAGKGRTGVIICVYLIHTGMWENSVEALRYYGVARTQNQKGVTIPSQRRWVNYYEQLMRLRRQGLSLPPSKWYRVSRIFVSKGCPSFASVTIFNNESKYILNKSQIKKVTDGYEILPTDAVINKDVKVQFDSGGLRKTRVFSLWFNSDFIDLDDTTGKTKSENHNNNNNNAPNGGGHGNICLRLDKEEIDKVNKDKKQKNFELVIHFEQVASKENQSQSNLKNGSNQNGNMLSLNVSQMSVEQIVVTALRLQDNVFIRNRGWKGVIYEDCFTGTDVCKWLKKEGGFHDNEQVLEYGNLLLKEGVMYAVKRDSEPLLKELKNGPFFYRFNTSPPQS